MENNYKIYLLTLPNGSVYIGRTKRSISSRLYEHKKDVYAVGRPIYNRPLYVTWRGVGEPFCEILEENLSYIEARTKEHDYTLAYIYMGFDVLNINIGDVLTEVTKEKISQGRLGEKHWLYGKHLSQETKDKLSKAFSGKNNPFYGKSHTTETKRKISEKNTAKLKGENNPSAKPKIYWETHSTFRYSFKKTCEVMGWDFDNFEEVFSGWYIKLSGKRERKYFYIEKLSH